MKFDPTISLNLIVELLVIVVGVVGAYYRLKLDIRASKAESDACLHALHAENSERLGKLEVKVGDLWEEFIGRKRQGGHGRGW